MGNCARSGGCALPSGRQMSLLVQCNIILKFKGRSGIRGCCAMSCISHTFRVKRFHVHVPKSDGVILFCYFTIRCLYKIQIPHPPLLIRFKHFGIGPASYKTCWWFTFCGHASEINEKRERGVFRQSSQVRKRFWLNLVLEVYVRNCGLNLILVRMGQAQLLLYTELNTFLTLFHNFL